MPEIFDPYQKWLGVPGGSRTPDHYRLLGLKPLEDDAQLIRKAAEERLARLRNVDPGGHGNDLQRLIAELTTAQQRLADPAKKAEYDESLRRKMAAKPKAASSGPSGTKLPTAKAVPPKSPSKATAPAPSPTEPMAAESAELDELLPPSAPTGYPQGGHSPMAPMAGMPDPMAAVPHPMQGLPNPMAPMPNPMAPSAPGYGMHGQPMHGQPMHAGYGAHPGMAYPGMAHPGMAQPQPMHEPVSSPIGAMDDGDQVSLTKLMKKKSRLVPTLILLGAVGVVLIGLGVAFSKGWISIAEPEKDPPTQVAQPTEPPKKPEDYMEPRPELEKLRRKKPLPQRNNPPAMPEMSEMPGTQMPATDMPKETMKPRPKPAPEMPKPMPEGEEVKIPPELKKLLTGVRTALGKRDLAAAQRYIDTAKTMATTPELEDVVQTTEMLQKYVVGFWEAVKEEVGNLQPTDQLTVGSTPFNVVDASPKELSIRILGQNKKYKVIEELPSGLAAMLAERRLDPSVPQNKVYLGAFQAVDPKGSVEEARRLWGEASLAGINTTSLMALVQPSTSEPETAAEMTDQPVPTAKAMAAAETALESTLAEIKAARTPAQKGELATKLMEEAASATDIAQRYVLLRNASELAAATDPAMAVEAVDEMAKTFKIDALEMKVTVLAKAAPAATPATAPDMAKKALELVDEAISEKKVELAEKLAAAALAAARKSKNLELMKEVNARYKEVQAMANE